MAPQVRDPGETSGIESIVDALAGTLDALDDGIASARAVRDQTFALKRTSLEGREIATLLEAELLPVRARLDAVLVELSAHRRMVAGAHRAATALEEREVHDFRRDLEILRARMAPYRRLDRLPAPRPSFVPEWRAAASTREPHLGRPDASEPRRADTQAVSERHQPAPNPFAFLLRHRSAVAQRDVAPEGSPSWAMDDELRPIAAEEAIDPTFVADDGAPVETDDGSDVAAVAAVGLEDDRDESGGADGPTADPAAAEGVAAAADHDGDAEPAADAHHPRARSRRRIRHRAAIIPALVIMMLALNTHGASLDAGTVAGSSRVAVAGPQATAARSGDAAAGLEAAARLDAAAPGDDTGAAAEAALQPGGTPASTTITGTAGGSSAAASRMPDAVLAGRSSLVAARTPIVAHVYYRVKTAQPLIALTFDDGYSATALRQIVAILEQQQIPATFFVNGMYLTRAPDVWQRIAADGFVVGNHTYRHTDVLSLTDTQVAADLARNNAAWEDLTGTPLAPLFRPPYGDHSAATDLAVARAGYPTIVLWNVTAGDTATNPTRSQLIANATKGTNGSIVLMHAGPAITPSVLPDVIAWYRARGFQFVTVPQLIAASGS